MTNSRIPFSAPALLLLGLFVPAAHAQGGSPRWMTEGPTLEQGPASFEVPLETLGRKLYVTVTLGGKPRRFVLDTGSPSMIDEALTDELGLNVVGTNRGRDAHGVVIESRIVQADLEIGGVSFRKVPLYSAPFSRSVARRAGARGLLAAATEWAVKQGASEMASDAALDNHASHRMHQALGFEETERVVYYRKALPKQ